MNKELKNLSLAFYWHMHQPVYELENTYLMPWARLHAVKDYLDMILVLDKYPKLKLNVNIVPALLDMLIGYAEKGYNDIHSELSVLDANNLSNVEKTFILNNFFASKFETMIYRSETYVKLYEKRFSKDVLQVNDFSAEEISDLLALFNLVWIDNVHFERYPRLKELWDKQSGYTQEDRVEIINIQKNIISEIIPTYKKFIKEGRLEITTSPYYHSILPILIDTQSAVKNVITKESLPSLLNMTDDAKVQITTALDRIEEVFGVRPKGMWPPEFCLCPKALKLLSKEGIKWTISDEGILASSINCDFVRDFKGNLDDPYHLLKVYNYKTSKSGDIDIIFRDRSIPNLINFEYCGVNSQMAAKDLYEKFKIIQNKLLVSPDSSHLLTIAMDSENCWENYQNDGNDFLAELYRLIEEDVTLSTVLISDYLAEDNYKKELNKIHAGSWIDKTFQYWIGEPEKNKAWLYLKNAKDEVENFKDKKSEVYKLAKKQLMIAEGSDWFWWYGEPNNSGQDFVFDYMFRERLKNIYNLIGVQAPECLNSPIITVIDVPFKRPKYQITPRMDGNIASKEDWYNAGSITMLDGPVFRENKKVDKINFGCDKENIYFRLHVSKNSKGISFLDKINQFYIYLRNATSIGTTANIRLINRTDNLYPILQEKFEHELTLTLVKDTLYPIRMASVKHENMWTLADPEGIVTVYDDVIDVSIPFDKIGIEKGQYVEFFMANTDSGVKNSYIPQETLISLERE